MRILLVEDEPSIVSFLQKSLKAENFIVDTATDGDSGSFIARTNNYDLIILDNILPKKNGHQVCQEIRASGKTAPILMVSALDTVQQKIDLLNAGADDYITKPFVFGELLARVQALLRRPRITNIQSIYKIGDIELDTGKYLVKKASKEINLAKKEFQLLELFMKNPGIVLSRQEILEQVWDRNADPFSNTIENLVANLRRKIDPNNTYIITVPGIGYKLKAQ